MSTTEGLSISTPLTTNAGGAQFSALEPDNEADRATVRNALRHWPGRWRTIDDSKKAGFVEGLVEAGEVARTCLKSADPKDALSAAGTMANIVRTAAMIEAQNQTDYWNNDKNERLDAGKATERIGTEPVVIEQAIEPPAKQLEGK